MKWRSKEIIEAIEITDAWFDGTHPNDVHLPNIEIDPVRREVRVPIQLRGGFFVANVGDYIQILSLGYNVWPRENFVVRFEPA